MPTDPKVVAYFKTNLLMAANKQIGYLNGDAYPVGWPTNVNPYTQNNFACHGPFTSQGEFCLSVSDGVGVDGATAVYQRGQRAHGLRPGPESHRQVLHDRHWLQPRPQSAHDRIRLCRGTEGWGGPEPGITVYGPGDNNNGAPSADSRRPCRCRANAMWVDDLGNYQWSEFTDYQSEAWPAAIYPVLAQSGTWSPAQGEPFLNPAASITPIANGSLCRSSSAAFPTSLMSAIGVLH